MLRGISLMVRRLFLILTILFQPVIGWADQRVLVLGDSNTWGSNASGPRHGDVVRWGRVVDAALPTVVVIEEGRIGRRSDLNFEYPVNPKTDPLPELVRRHLPLDLVVVMLGTNDLQSGLNRTPQQVAASAVSLGQLIQEAQINVLLVVPPPLHHPEDGALGHLFNTRSAVLSRQLAPAYRAAAQRANLSVFDAGQVSVADGRDGVHLTAGTHRRLGVAIAHRVETLLAQGK